MRPIFLSLAGLNSYDEVQTIDFRRLCTGTVFGIFGATGSGKSTVIDAITLALYGQVERAPSKTQGIINPSGDSASVVFEFALGSSHGEKVYRCERKYTTKDGAITCRLARFSELEGAQYRVIADNARQVDAAVVSTLGLTADDFTRAVVLPQGRFAEFLSLKGAERRTMLERILNLGSFGQALMGRVKLRHDAAQSDLEKVEAEQKGLGAASAADLAAVREAAQQAHEQVKTAKQELLHSEGEFLQAKEVAALMSSLASAHSELAKLEADSERIGQLRHETALLEAAVRIEPRLRDYYEAQTVLCASRSRLEDCVRSLSDLRTEEAAQQEALAVATAARQENEPILIARLTQLQQAISLEQKILEQRAELAALEQELTALARELHDAEAEMARVSAAETTASVRQKDLQQELAALTFSAAERGLLERAAMQDVEAQSLRQQVDTLKRTLSERQAAREAMVAQQVNARRRVATLTQEMQAQVAELNELMAACETEVSAIERERSDLCRVRLVALRSVYSQHEKLMAKLAVLAVRKDKCRELLAQLELDEQDTQAQAVSAENRAEELSQAMEFARLGRAAGELAKTLIPHTPCPVCGSSEHPSPAPDSEDDGDSLAAQHRLACEREQVLLRSLAVLSVEQELKRQEYLGISAEIDVLEAEREHLEVQIADLRQHFPSEWQGLPEPALTEAVEFQAALLTARMTQRGETLQAVETLRASAEDKRAQLGPATEGLAVITQSLVSLDCEIDKESGWVRKLECEEGKVLGELTKTLAALNANDLGAARAVASAREQRHALVTLEAAELLREIGRLREQMSALTNAVQNSRTKATTVQADVAHRRRAVKDKDEELLRLIGQANVSPSAAHAQTEASLGMLRAKEAQLKNLLVAVGLRREEAASAEDKAEEAWQLSEKRLRATEQMLTIELAQAGIQSPAEAEQILARKQGLAVWREEIARHAQQTMLAEALVRQLEQALGGRHATHEQYAECEQSYARAQQAYSDSMGRAGEWQNKLSDMTRRHSRFVELEVKQRELSHHKGLLTELVSLLRGNTLVDFLAGQHLCSIAGMATERLRVLTSNRYALEVGEDGGFLMRDDANGGLKRAVHTLSGGETFVTSLALALALSAEIQLRGKYPLEFFFLDEGFGTLDPMLLETVMTSLERMQGQRLSIGVISHVPELQERIAKKVLVTPAVPGGRGSRLKVEVY